MALCSMLLPWEASQFADTATNIKTEENPKQIFFTDLIGTCCCNIWPELKCPFQMRVWRNRMKRREGGGEGESWRET